MAVLAKYGWIIAIISIAFCFSAFGNGANDVANSYATSVAARTLTMPQVGFLSMITEFVGAVALGARVTSTIKNSIISISRYEGRPAVLMLAMGCAEVGSASWLMIATSLGLPVSTTQTIVGALIGVGFASESPIKWRWDSGSVSQVAASWAVSPAIAAGFAAIIFGTIKYAVLERQDAFTWGLRLIPMYLAFTGAILALFIVIEAPTAPSLEEFGAGKATGIILGVLVGLLVIAYVFFLPYFHRRLVKGDTRIKWWHLPLGPTLWKEDPWIYLPAKSEIVVIDYYENAFLHNDTSSSDGSDIAAASGTDEKHAHDATATSSALETGELNKGPSTAVRRKKYITPRERFLSPTEGLPITHPSRLWSWTKFVLLRGVTTDCVSHSNPKLQQSHALVKQYDNKIEHLWTYAQVGSAMVMSIAHGSNDVANAVGPWAAAYATYQAGEVETKSPTPVWILVVAGFLLGAGFWFFGYHIIKSLGNRITQHSPTRGFSMELGAAITVLLASRLGLPVSTTQCLTGATLGVALMSFQLGAVDWKHMAFIFMGWVLTLPVAGLISGMLMLLALNAPHL